MGTRSHLRELVDPELLVLVGVPLDELADVVAQLAPRDHQRAEPGASTDLVVRSDHLVPGDPPVPVRVHRPRGVGGMRPCVYSIHGGGYIAGSHDDHDPLFERWCPMFGCVGVAVDYRLAPATPYPGPLEDCYAGLVWTWEHADELGVDRDRIGVMGGSAGGGLAAALALLCRDRQGPPLAFQLLECPMLDDRQITPSSRLEDLPVWSRASNAFGWQAHLGELHGTDDVPYTAAPARAVDLSGLPPAFVAVGAVDGFRDEDVDYATRLNQAGVPTELHVYPGGLHGYQLVPGARLTQRAQRITEEWLAQRLER
ncbi:MAG TPA: alpha/beta hydrolase [Nitriliruptorales bacterium]